MPHTISYSLAPIPVLHSSPSQLSLLHLAVLSRLPPLPSSPLQPSPSLPVGGVGAHHKRTAPV